MNHTPTPWRVCVEPTEIGRIGSKETVYIDSEKYRLAQCKREGRRGKYCVSAEIPLPEVKANAAFIVTACNAHEDLVKALKLHKKFWDEMPKGQLGKLVCDIGVLNDVFLSTSKALAKAGVKP